jgi:hypothetical protein
MSASLIGSHAVADDDESGGEIARSYATDVHDSELVA